MKPQLPENFIPLMSAHVTLPKKQFAGNHREYWQGVAVEVYGDYWENIAAFEQRKTNERVAREDAERLAAIEARQEGREQETKEPAKKPPKKSASFNEKKAFYGSTIRKMRKEGKSTSDIARLLGMGVKTVYKTLQAS